MFMILPSEQKGANTDLRFPGISRISAGKFAAYDYSLQMQEYKRFSYFHHDAADSWQREDGGHIRWTVLRALVHRLLVIDWGQ